MGRFKGSGDAARSAVRRRSHWRTQPKATIEKPHDHMQSNTAGTLIGAGVFASGGGKGWLICWITDDSGAAGIAIGAVAGALRYSMWLPRLSSRVNGIRNLTDAVNQSQ